MRKPEPWYWKSRGGWYVQIDKKQVKLGAAPPSKNPPQAIMLEFHRVMASAGMLSAVDRQRASTAEIVDAYIDLKSGQRKRTVEKYVCFLSRFVSARGSKKMRDIRIADITKWIDGQENWGDATKHGTFQIVQTVFRWAKDAGYIEFNPLAGAANKWPRGMRQRGLTAEEFEKLLAIADDDFALVIRVLRDTGCRPGELCVLTAAHLHTTDPCAILKPSEHKTGGRTGRPRVIVLPGNLNKELRELAKQRPEGPLLLTSRWKVRWTPCNIQQRFQRARKKLGFPPEVQPYASRHAFVTRLIQSGVPDAVAAKIAGHSNSSITLSTYTHLQLADMMRAVDGAAKQTTQP